MKVVPFFNKTNRYVHIGATTIPPNETRDVDASLVPHGAAVGAEAVSSVAAPGAEPTGTVTDPQWFNDLLEQSVAAIRDALPQLDDAQLAEVGQREEAAAAPRKGVLEAVKAEQLKRAAE